MVYSLEHHIAFTVAAALLTVTPGLDTALVLRTRAVEGAHQAMLAGLGIVSGCLVWGVLAGLGLGAMLATSQVAYDILRWVGAAYLLYLGIGLIRAPRTSASLAADAGEARARGQSWFARGLLTNLLNPKIGVFYVAFLPQFIPAGSGAAAFSILLAATHAVLGITWFAILSAAMGSVSGWLRRPAVLAWLDRLAGGLLVAFGLRLVASASR